MALESYFDELADYGRPLRIGKLTNLSGLTPEERVEFGGRWPEIEADRRLQIVSELVELAEDNPELDFTNVLLDCLVDTDARVRAAAIDGLWEYDERSFIPTLIDLLRGDEDVEVRASAALALGRFVVLGEFGRLRASDLTSIEDVLTEVINDTAEAEEVRARAVEAIGARSETWVRDIIADAYSSGIHRMEVSALNAMGRSCDPYWLPDVIRHLQSDDPEFRYEAAIAAGMIGDEQAVPHLAFLINDEDSEAQEMAIEALGEIGGGEAEAILRRELNHPDERVREVVREALASIDLGGALGDGWAFEDS